MICISTFLIPPLSLFMLPPVGKGAISVALVRPSVAHIADNSRTQKPSMPKFGRKVPHLWCDLHTSYKVKRSKDKVTRPINADAYRVQYFPNGKTYERQTWYTDGGRWPASVTGATTSKVKGQARKVTCSVWAVLAQYAVPVSLEAGGGIPCRPKRWPRFLFYLLLTLQWKGRETSCFPR